MTYTAQLTLLDGFALVRGRQRVDVSRTLQHLIAFVGLRRQATRTQTIGALWPESTEDRALGSLRTALWRLHQLGVPVVTARGEVLSVAELVRVDVHELIRSARLALTPDGPAADVGPLVDGPRELLPGWYDDWVLIERERLRQLYLHALESLARSELRAGRYPAAVEAALAAMRAEPLRESPHRLLIEVHLAEGNYCEALGAYQAYRTMVRRELGVDPSPTMRALVRRPGGPTPGSQVVELLRPHAGAAWYRDDPRSR